MTTLVIGAGPAGLAAIQSMKAAGHAIEAVEQNADVGGQWLYGAAPSAVYASTHLISSKRTTAFADFPMPEDWPAYPSHRQVLDYLQAYARHFDLYPLIRFNTGVRSINREGEGWRATFSDGASTAYAGVIIANGHLSDPLIPRTAGTFDGPVMHAKDYKTADIFDGKRVLVVGMGNTGCDIVVDAVHRADKVLWSVRGGNHFVPKFLGGKPADEGNHKPKRFIIPKGLRARLHEPILRFIVGPPERFGLPKPEHRLYDRTPIVNSLVLQHLGQGDVDVRKPIREFAGKRVVFADGQSDEVDLVLLATGYRITFPFLDDLSALDWQQAMGAPRLFMNMFPSEDNGLYVAGLLEGAGVGWEGRALQARDRGLSRSARRASGCRCGVATRDRLVVRATIAWGRWRAWLVCRFFDLQARPATRFGPVELTRQGSITCPAINQWRIPWEHRSASSAPTARKPRAISPKPAAPMRRAWS